MATLPDLVAPFRGERYRASDRLTRLIAPPYDVITPADRAGLAARDDHNIVHLMLPEATPGEDKYARAARLLAEWRAGGVLARDDGPTVTVMAQTFTLPDGTRRVRTGLFAAVAAEGYEPRRVRPHERTHRGPKADRLALLRATRTNLESIFLLAPDPRGDFAAGLAALTRQAPEASAELDGVELRSWRVEAAAAAALTAPLSRLYIADGHHRYETASAYAAEDRAADRVLGFIVSVRDPGLVVLPTHRIIHGAGREPGRLLDSWRNRFDVEPLAPTQDPMPHLAAASGQTACVVVVPGGQAYLLRLRPDADLHDFHALEPNPAVRALDVARLEALVVKEIIQQGESTVTLEYSADPAKALAPARSGRAATVAVLLNPTPVDQVFAVADSGGVMPPKSTYFVPKVPSGVVFKPAQ